MALISVIRIGYLHDLHQKKDPDFAWAGARFAFLSLVEVNAGITVACLMTLRPLANRVFPSLLSGNSLQELPGDTPPTIGTRGRPRNANPGYRNSEGDKAGIEAWEMVGTDSRCRIPA